MKRLWKLWKQRKIGKTKIGKKRIWKKKIGKKEKRNNKLEKILIFFSFSLILFTIFISIILFVPKSKTNKNIEIYIQEGSSLSQVADILYKNGIIKSKEIFILYTKVIGRERDIKRGYYQLSPSYSLVQVVNKLVNGENLNIKVTIPEGASLKEIGIILEEHLNISKDLFLKYCTYYDYALSFLKDYKEFFGGKMPLSLEGYLFPSTYFFPKGIKEKEIIEILLKEFFKQILTNFPDYKEDLKKIGLGFNEWVILASIVEKEAKIDRERPLIAGVFINRLKKGYMLQSCATVEYLYNFKKNPLLYKDLEIDSPYNTYKNYGLPPTPICSPSLKSLEAVLHPEGDYLFFVSNNDGTHTFSKTYEEHLKAQGYKR
jgi:UPF0755 protein